ncbi:UNVERIFIED_CONTAM: hypothetical protein FKN15_056553 [Acipenser sinensis]
MRFVFQRSGSTGINTEFSGWPISVSPESVRFLAMPGGRRGPSRQQLSRSALPSLQTLRSGSTGISTEFSGWAIPVSPESVRFLAMPGGRRGPSRQQLSRSALPSLQTLVGGSCSNGTGLRNRNSTSVGLSAPPITALITPEPVRHRRVPELPLDGSLLFEFLFFIYLLIALFVQYINIYKTVWWYPYSHPAASTSLATQTGPTSVVRYTVLIAARFVLLTLCGWVLCWTLVSLFRNHSVLNLLFLGYPFGVYVPLCCFHQESRSQLLPTDCGYLDQEQLDGPLIKSKDFLTLLRENLKEQFNNPTSIPVHSCPLSPDLIRNEVECLKSDFNKRIKEVLFNSLFSAYYVAFLPLCFVKSTQYYDMRWSCEHLIMVWINAFVMLMSQLLPPKYCNLLHRSAAHLGKWQKLEHGSYSNAPQHVNSLDSNRRLPDYRAHPALYVSAFTGCATREPSGSISNSSDSGCRVHNPNTVDLNMHECGQVYHNCIGTVPVLKIFISQTLKDPEPSDSDRRQRGALPALLFAAV